MVMIMFGLCLGFFLINAVANYWVGGRDVLYPGFLFGFVWVSIFAVYVFSGLEIDAIGFKTCALLVLGACAFSLGCYGSRLLMPDREPAPATEVPYRNVGKYVLFGYCLLVFPLFYRDIQNLTGAGFASLMDVRSAINSAAVDGERAFSNVITGSILMVSVSTTFIIYIDPGKKRTLWFLSMGLTLLYCLLNTARSSLFTLLAGATTLYLFRKHKPIGFVWAVRKLSLPVVMVVVFLMVFMFMTHITDSEGTTSLAVDYLFMYLIGSLAALNTVVYGIPAQPANHTFRFFAEISNGMAGTHFRLPPSLDAFINVPFPTNVYTVYKFFFQDFGFFGTLLVMAVIGCVQGLIYRHAKRGNRYALYAYAVLAGPLLLSFFDDTYSDFRGFTRSLLVLIFCYLVVPLVVKGLLELKPRRVVG